MKIKIYVSPIMEESLFSMSVDDAFDKVIEEVEVIKENDLMFYCLRPNGFNILVMKCDVVLV